MMASTTYILYYPGSGAWFLVPGSGWSVQGARLQVLGSGWRNTRLSARNSSSLIGYYGRISVWFFFHLVFSLLFALFNSTKVNRS